MQKELQDIEDKILYLLENCKGNILDDVEIIHVLDQSTKTSDDIKKKVAEAEITARDIEQRKAEYITLSQHAAVLFFGIVSLAEIDPMYNYSLQWFTALFIRATEEADAADDVEGRINNLKGYFNLLYDQVCLPHSLRTTSCYTASS